MIHHIPTPCPRRGAGSSGGFTLIELMVTLAVLAVLLALAAPSFVEWQRSTKLTSITNELVNALGMARSEALKRNHPVRLEFIEEDNRPIGWRVYVDTDFSSDFDEDDDEQLLDTTASATPPLPDYITTGLDSSKKGTVVFSGSGFANSSNQTIKFSYGSSQTRHIVISATGRVRTCRPASGQTTC